jgi:hypothetical protein
MGAGPSMFPMYREGQVTEMWAYCRDEGAVVVHVSVFWDITPYIPLKFNRIYELFFFCHLLSPWFFRKVNWFSMELLICVRFVQIKFICVLSWHRMSPHLCWGTEFIHASPAYGVSLLLGRLQHRSFRVRREFKNGFVFWGLHVMTDSSLCVIITLWMYIENFT